MIALCMGSQLIFVASTPVASFANAKMSKKFTYLSAKKYLGKDFFNSTVGRELKL